MIFNVSSTCNKLNLANIGFVKIKLKYTTPKEKEKCKDFNYLKILNGSPVVVLNYFTTKSLPWFAGLIEW